MGFSAGVTDLRAGSFFRLDDGQVYEVLGYKHIKRGRGGAIIKLKVQNIRSRVVKEITFKSGSKVTSVETLKSNKKFVYYDGKRETITLSDPVTKERITVVGAKSMAERVVSYLAEGHTVLVLQVDREVAALELPAVVKLKVTETSSREKGNTAGSARKRATLESGLVVSVPMFVKVGEIIKVNTQTGQYIERA